MSISIILAYMENKSKTDPLPKKKHDISIIIPMWNEEKTIKATLDSVLSLRSNYIKSGFGNVEILVIDDNSTDNSFKIAKEYELRCGFVRVLFKKGKRGKSESLNEGIALAKYDLIATIDADSFPYSDSLRHIVGYFEDSLVGAVATKLRVRTPKKLVEKFQEIEYFYSNFYLRALEYLDSIYVTRGPLSVFRKSVLQEIGGFVSSNVTPTEDMEITFRIRKAGYNIKYSRNAFVETKVMPSFKALLKQRVRWNTGTIRTFILHKDMILNPEYGLFGSFVSPMVAYGLLIVVVAFYYLIQSLIRHYNDIMSFLWHITNFIPFDFSWFWLMLNNLWFYIPNFIIIFVVAFILLISVYLFAFKESNESLINYLFSFILYVCLYYVFLLCSFVYSIILLISKSKVSWR